ncbi:MAG: helix-turn-helix domain-containing protein, partial [Clostridia bacterium]|nr:helix-turn-helix domain-containing protein [Clostridia bacterium]
MERLTAQEIATQWGVSLRYVQALCQKGRIEGIVKKGRDWMIPADALRPADGRTRA